MAADYTDTATALAYLGARTFDETNDAALLATFITAHSRMVDRETGKPPGFWAPQTVTRKYSGDGTQLLEIDPFDAIASVTMALAVDRSDVVTLNTTAPNDWNFYVPKPDSGPPYDALYLTRGWLPDLYRIGNVLVTGTASLPPELAYAVNAWVAHSWSRMKANFADSVSRPDGPTRHFRGKPPDDVQRILEYFRGEEERVWFV